LIIGQPDRCAALQHVIARAVEVPCAALPTEELSTEGEGATNERSQGPGSGISSYVFASQDISGQTRGIPGSHRFATFV
jgi:hypothetical protein